MNISDEIGNITSTIDIISGLPTIRPECELDFGCMYSAPSARFSALHTFQASGPISSDNQTPLSSSTSAGNNLPEPM
ncbi:MAG: hypothetical protein ABSG70_16780 [Terriglobales bacterium]